MADGPGELVRPPSSEPDLQTRCDNLAAEVGRLLREVADLEAQNYALQLEVDASR